MSETNTGAEHSRSLRTIADHFSGRTSPRAESAMRAHMPACTECREVYQGYLILEQLDPTAMPARQRIAHGLALLVPRSLRVSAWWLALAIPVATALMLAWLPARTADPVQLAAGTFTARSTDLGSALRPGFWVYRLDAADQPRMVDRVINRGDELAFAYSNPGGKLYLMIFAVDDKRKVYWFHPAWPTGASPPVARPALPGPGPHELPEAIRHDLEGRHLQLYALFTDVKLDTMTIERRVRSTSGMEIPANESTIVNQRGLEVRR
jgi:hypothetical protein